MNSIKFLEDTSGNLYIPYVDTTGVLTHLGLDGTPFTGDPLTLTPSCYTSGNMPVVTLVDNTLTVDGNVIEICEEPCLTCGDQACVVDMTTDATFVGIDFTDEAAVQLAISTYLEDNPTCGPATVFNRTKDCNYEFGGDGSIYIAANSNTVCDGPLFLKWTNLVFGTSIDTITDANCNFTLAVGAAITGTPINNVDLTGPCDTKSNFENSLTTHLNSLGLNGIFAVSVNGFLIIPAAGVCPDYVSYTSIDFTFTTSDPSITSIEISINNGSDNEQSSMTCNLIPLYLLDEVLMDPYSEVNGGSSECPEPNNTYTVHNFDVTDFATEYTADEFPEILHISTVVNGTLITAQLLKVTGATHFEYQLANGDPGNFPLNLNITESNQWIVGNNCSITKVINIPLNSVTSVDGSVNINSLSEGNVDLSVIHPLYEPKVNVVALVGDPLDSNNTLLDCTLYPIGDYIADTADMCPNFLYKVVSDGVGGCKTILITKPTGVSS